MALVCSEAPSNKRPAASCWIRPATAGGATVPEASSPTVGVVSPFLVAPQELSSMACRKRNGAGRVTTSQPRTPRTGTSNSVLRHTRHDQGPAATITVPVSMRPSSLSTPVTRSPVRMSSRTPTPVRMIAPAARASSARATTAAPGSMRRASSFSHALVTVGPSSGSIVARSAPWTWPGWSSPPTIRQPCGSRSRKKALSHRCVEFLVELNAPSGDRRHFRWVRTDHQALVAPRSVGGQAVSFEQLDSNTGSGERPGCGDADHASPNDNDIWAKGHAPPP